MGKHHIVHNPEGADFEFEGEQLIDQTSAELGHLQVYRTDGGSYVVRQHRGYLPYKSGISRAAVLGNLGEVAEWLGTSQSAKNIMEQLGQPYRRQIR